MRVLSNGRVTADVFRLARDDDGVQIRLALTGCSVRLITSHLPDCLPVLLQLRTCDANNFSHAAVIQILVFMFLWFLGAAFWSNNDD